MFINSNHHLISILFGTEYTKYSLQPGLYEVQSGVYANSPEEFLVHFLNSHFLESTFFSNYLTNIRINTVPSVEDWVVARKIISSDKLKWSIFSFQRLKLNHLVITNSFFYSFTIFFLLYVSRVLLIALFQLTSFPLHEI